MKKFRMIYWLAASLFTTHVLAGSLTVNGNFTVNSNLIAQSISLGGITETNWNFLPLQGYKYVIVPEGTNDTERGSNLLAAYARATTLSPTSSNRVAVIVPPGSYNLGSSNLVMNTSYVELIGLVPAQMTSKQVFTDSSGRQRIMTVANVQCPVLIYSSASASTLAQSVDYVRIESVILTNTGSGNAYSPSVYGINTVLRHASMSSMEDHDYLGQYIDCVGGGSSFALASIVGGTFIDCVGGDQSFGGDLSGTFIDCTGGDGSFGSGYGTDANGYFKGCVAGYESFGGNAQAAGTFIDCVAGSYSFGGSDPFNEGTPDAGGTFVNCVGGPSSFGGGVGLDSTAKLQHCHGGDGSFGDFNMASDDFNYNVGGTNTFLMLPQLPTSGSTNGLPSGTVYNSSGTLKVMP